MVIMVMRKRSLFLEVTIGKHCFGRKVQREALDNFTAVAAPALQVPYITSLDHKDHHEGWKKICFLLFATRYVDVKVKLTFVREGRVANSSRLIRKSLHGPFCR